MATDTQEGYGLVSKSFHWVMALLVGWQFLKFFDRIGEGEHWVGQTLVPWHISIGVLLLVMAAARFGWALNQRGRRPLNDPAMDFFIKAGHGLIYATLILLPLTGIMLMVGAGFGVTAFGVELIAKGEKIGWAQGLGSLHSPLAWILAALVIGHIAMALFHQFVRRDGTLDRML